MPSLNNSILIISKMLLFSEKPQNLPASYGLVVFYAIALLLATSLLGTLGQYYENFRIATVQIAIYAATVWVFLRLSGRAGRWKQTITALFGTACLIRALSHFPIALVWSNVRTNPEGAIWVAMTAIPFGLWSLAVSVLIIKESLEVSGIKAFAISFGLALLTSLMAIFILGLGSPQAGT